MKKVFLLFGLISVFTICSCDDTLDSAQLKNDIDEVISYGDVKSDRDKPVINSMNFAVSRQKLAAETYLPATLIDYDSFSSFGDVSPYLTNSVWFKIDAFDSTTRIKFIRVKEKLIVSADGTEYTDDSKLITVSTLKNVFADSQIARGSFEYKPHTPEDGIIELSFSAVDFAGNESEQSFCCYVLKCSSLMNQDSFMFYNGIQLYSKFDGDLNNVNWDDEVRKLNFSIESSYVFRKIKAPASLFTMNTYWGKNSSDIRTEIASFNGYADSNKIEEKAELNSSIDKQSNTYIKAVVTDILGNTKEYIRMIPKRPVFTAYMGFRAVFESNPSPAEDNSSFYEFLYVTKSSGKIYGEYDFQINKPFMQVCFYNYSRSIGSSSRFPINDYCCTVYGFPLIFDEEPASSVELEGLNLNGSAYFENIDDSIQISTYPGPASSGIFEADIEWNSDFKIPCDGKIIYYTYYQDDYGSRCEENVSYSNRFKLATIPDVKYTLMILYIWTDQEGVQHSASHFIVDCIDCDYNNQPPYSWGSASNNLVYNNTETKTGFDFIKIDTALNPNDDKYKGGYFNIYVLPFDESVMSGKEICLSDDYLARFDPVERNIPVTDTYYLRRPFVQQNKEYLIHIVFYDKNQNHGSWAAGNYTDRAFKNELNVSRDSNKYPQVSLSLDSEENGEIGTENVTLYIQKLSDGKWITQSSVQLKKNNSDGSIADGTYLPKDLLADNFHYRFAVVTSVSKKQKKYTYLYTGNPDSNLRQFFRIDNQVNVLSDNNVLIHTLICQKNLGDDPEIWEIHNASHDIQPVQMEACSYTIPLNQIPEGYWYTVVAHFADGSVEMTEPLQKN